MFGIPGYHDCAFPYLKNLV